MEKKGIVIPSGIHKDASLNYFNENSRRVLELICRTHFRLTYTNTTSNYNLPYGILKATNSIEKQFDLESEILFISSEHRQLQPRTYDAIEWAYKYHPNRLDPIICIIASSDPDCEDKINTFFKSKNSAQIVIPINVEDFIVNGRDDAYLVKILRRTLFLKDLFNDELPVKEDKFFFGRNDLIMELISKFRNGENCSVFGIRKAGKTSLIYKINRTLKSQNDYSVYIDCQNNDFKQRSWHEAFRYIINQAIEELLPENKKLQYVSGNQLGFKSNLYNFYTEVNAVDSFIADVKNLIAMLAKNDSKKRVLFIMDEIERISYRSSDIRHWKDGEHFVYFWQNFRSIIQNHNDLMSVMIVGTNPSCVEKAHIGEVDNPIFNFFPRRYIAPFNEKDTREMTKLLGKYCGLKFDSNISTHLCNDFGGQPYLIKKVCSLLHQNISSERPHSIKISEYQAAKSQFVSRTDEYNEMIVKVLQDYYPEELDMLIYLAKDDLTSFNSLASEFPIVVEHLLSYGIIDQAQNGFSFKIEGMKRFLSLNSEREQIERYKKMTEGRNKIEYKLKQTVFATLKRIHRGDEAKAKAHFIKFIPSENRSQVNFESLSFSQTMSADFNKLLYLNLLKDAIIKDWKEYDYLFDCSKQEFVTKMTFLNGFGRSDTHNKTVSADEFDRLKLLFAWFDQCLV